MTKGTKTLVVILDIKSRTSEETKWSRYSWLIRNPKIFCTTVDCQLLINSKEGVEVKLVGKRLGTVYLYWINLHWGVCDKKHVKFLLASHSNQSKVKYMRDF